MLPPYSVGAKREPPLLSNIIIMVGSCVHSESNAIIIVKKSQRAILCNSKLPRALMICKRQNEENQTNQQ